MPPCAFDLNHKSRLVMHCYITDCLARGMTVSAVPCSVEPTTRDSADVQISNVLPTEKAIVCVLTQSAKMATGVRFLSPRRGVFHIQGKCP